MRSAILLRSRGNWARYGCKYGFGEGVAPGGAREHTRTIKAVCIDSCRRLEIKLKLPLMQTILLITLARACSSETRRADSMPLQRWTQADCTALRRAASALVARARAGSRVKVGACPLQRAEGDKAAVAGTEQLGAVEETRIASTASWAPCHTQGAQYPLIKQYT